MTFTHINILHFWQVVFQLENEIRGREKGNEIVNADLCPTIETKHCKLKQLAFAF